MKSAQVAPCEVWIHLQSDLIWLVPAPSKDMPSQDQILDGVVEVECPTDRPIQGIDLRLVGVQKVGYPIANKEKSKALHWEEEVIFDRTLVIDKTKQAGDQALFLTKGVHDFEFHMILPAWVAPYERCRYGHTKYTLTSTVRGAGKNGGDVSVSRDIVPVQQQTPESGPLAFELTYHDTHESLHDMTISLTSMSLSVAGVLQLSMVHPTPPPSLNVLMVRVFVEQTYELYYPATDTWEAMPMEKLKVWELGVPPPRTRDMNQAKYWELGLWTAEGVQSGTRLGKAARSHIHVVRPLSHPHENGGCTGYRLKTAVRLPDHHHLRPTTMKGTHTRLWLSHAIGLEVLFLRLDQLDHRPESEMTGLAKPQVFSMLKTVAIPSCECTHDSIHLPPYMEASPVASVPESPRPSGRTLTLPLPRTDAPLSSQPEWNKLLHSLQALSKQRRRHRLSGLRATANEATSVHHAPSTSAPSSRPPSLVIERSTPSTPVIPVRRPNDVLVTQRSQSQPADHGVPRNLPVGTPWAVSNMPPRSGEGTTCNCARTTAQLQELDERLMEGAPTAPGAWNETATSDAVPPPWTPSSRPTSPTNEWYVRARGSSSKSVL
ncbi:hypothetical protein MNAN1_000418 [Malassezia nana]|uniref:Arrestin-like N-terminal domain-containing protein n=1 Tax=Malassezia nana TaxID=180528 RepID=A0AAF0EJF7_9BASI|nr:hypothetical protein MNAN1_000418 [Malassezia nana]